MTTEKNNHSTPILIGVSIVVLLLIVVFFVCVIAVQKASDGSQIAEARLNSDENLRPVEGAYGWKLGDKLPDDLETTTNNYTLMYYPPIDAGWDGWLTLTEERRIAEIDVSLGMGATNINQIKAILREKYGFRQFYKFPNSDYTVCYGATNREAALHVSSFSFLTYRDTALSQIADSQTEQRKTESEAATKKQVEDDLKSKL